MHHQRGMGLRIGGGLVIAGTLAFLILPLVAMLVYSLRFPLTGQWTTQKWQMLFSGAEAGSNGTQLTVLREGVVNSLALALFTVVLMLVLLLPTMLALRLHRSRLRRVVEFVCLLPLALPAIVLVVGLGPIYRFMAINVTNTDAIWLTFAYVILVLPYAYRALDAGLSAMPTETLVHAARSLGAGWFTVIFRVIVPNMRQAIASAAFISVAVVLGEFTIASLLNRTNLQVSVNLLGQSDSMLATAVALIVMLFGVVLLLGLDYASHWMQRRNQARNTRASKARGFSRAPQQGGAAATAGAAAGAHEAAGDAAAPVAGAVGVLAPVAPGPSHPGGGEEAAHQK